MFNLIHKVQMPCKMSYPLFMFISSPSQNRRILIAKCSSLLESQKSCLEITVLARIAEYLEIKIVSAVINLHFCVDNKKGNLPENLPWAATGIPRNEFSSHCQVIEKLALIKQKRVELAKSVGMC